MTAVPIQARGSDDPPRPGTTFSASATAFHQPGVNIDGGGEFTLSSGLFRLGVKLPISPATVIGLSVKYDVDDYDFSGLTEFGGLDPWNDVRRFGVSIPIILGLGQSWSLGLSPSIDWLQEYGADSSDSLTYGSSVFAFKSFAKHKRLGLGAGVFRNVEGDVEGFPFIAVDWRFNERWRLSNPFEADVLGPAGLELSYTINERWHIGGGGVYRAFRFRLDDEGVAPNGIGENKGIATFLRLNRSVKSGLDLDIYVGATVRGELELKNADGDRLASSDYSTAPFIAITFGGEF
jgi:hypothetical protein